MQTGICAPHITWKCPLSSLAAVSMWGTGADKQPASSKHKPEEL